MNEKAGLYFHIPFCRSRCPYCDFYSFSGKSEQKAEYVAALQKKIVSSTSALQSSGVCKADTLYIGGGTPSVLGAKKLADLVNACNSGILTDDAEITVECNPYGLDEDFFKILHEIIENEQASVVMTSHIETEINQKMDYVGILNQGKMISFGEAGD